MKLTIQLLTLAFVSLANTGFAQLAINQWSDHFPWGSTIAITHGDEVVYCATDLGVVAYDLTDNSILRMTKANRLSDVGVSSINYNSFSDALVVAYTNGNVDLIKGDVTINMADIERSGIIGDKSINHIYFQNQLAYLSTGFGIVVLDLDREEVKDTYIIGPLESQIKINAVTVHEPYIYAATEDEGLYRAFANDPNLANFNNWSKINSIPNSNGPFSDAVSFDGKLWVNFDAGTSDTLYHFDGSTWQEATDFSGTDHAQVKVDGGKLIVVSEYLVKVYSNTTTQQIDFFANANNEFFAKDAIHFSGFGWVADNTNGIRKMVNSFSGETILPNGPSTASAWQLDNFKGQIWAVAGGLANAWAPNFEQGVGYHLNEGTWTSINRAQDNTLDTISTILAIAVDPLDEGHAYAGSWMNGLIEFQDDRVVQVYNHTNSSLQKHPQWPNTTRIGVGGVDFDRDGNLWMSNSGVGEPLSVFTADGAWKSFEFGSSVNNKSLYGMMVDQNNLVWFISRDAGLVVFNPGETPTSTSDDQFKLLINAPGSGNLPSNTVNCMTEDLDGEVWVGTNEGIGVFYSPQNIFSSGADFDAQQILLEQDGNIQILLETEIITCITVDGANRKWIGTRGAGVFLMSDDGTDEVHAFNTDNSPLISNNINDIAVNHVTGEVLFATDLGIISFQGTSTGFTDEFEDVYSFPNPVREDYDGPIAIRGLLQDTDVKITDASGNLVFETTSTGGMAIWDGKTFGGERVNTGIYLVFCSDQEGETTMVSKIMVVH